MVNSENQHTVYSRRDTGEPLTVAGMPYTVYRIPLSPFTLHYS